MKYKMILLALLVAIGFMTGQAQVDNVDAKPTIQPTIMVIPFAKKGQSIRSQLENNELVRIAITKVKEGFDQRGVNTIDLRAKLKQLSNNEVLQEDQKTSLKDEVIKLSGADVYVEVEANANRSSSGNSVNVLMTAFDAFSGESFSNKVVNSPKFYTDNYEKLVGKAVEEEIDNFLNTINEKFSLILENGRTLTLNVGIDMNADLDFDLEVGEDLDLLSDAIEDWVMENAYKNYYHMQGMTADKLVFDQIKVPVKDANGNNFRVSKFASKLRKYLKSLGLESSRVVQGNNISITINDFTDE